MPRLRPVADWRLKYGVVNPDTTEIIGASLWDRQTYVSATTTRMTFFSTIPANKRAGNLTIAGQLAAGTAFLIRVIRLVTFVAPASLEGVAGATDPLPGAANDLFLLYTNSVVSIDILNKRYAEYPGYLLHPGTGLAHSAGLNVSSTAGDSVGQLASWGQPDPRAVFKLAVPIVIPPQTNFTTVLEFPAGAVTLSGGDTDLAILLDGELARPTQ